MGKLIHSTTIQARLTAVQEEHDDVVSLMTEQDAADLVYRPDYVSPSDAGGLLETGLELGMKAEGRDVTYVEIWEPGQEDDDPEAVAYTLYWIGTEAQAADRVEIFLCDLAVNRGEISPE